MRFASAALDKDHKMADAFALAQMPRRDMGEHRIGLAWITPQVDEVDSPVLFHNGGTGGFRSFFAVCKEKDAAVVVLNNSQDSVDRLGLEILRQVTETK